MKQQNRLLHHSWVHPHRPRLRRQHTKFATEYYGIGCSSTGKRSVEASGKRNSDDPLTPQPFHPLETMFYPLAHYVPSGFLFSFHLQKNFCGSVHFTCFLPDSQEPEFFSILSNPSCSKCGKYG
ncbi:hypothetical protein L2E82_45501 [Cichorium intybus]|uniref:Uncharacterized protein n=1 Tax=Cichorium intybus TaxID=13427 RepID=A0ACB8ZU15_CICIN|nr:hypothetical protein L2E82_45501 [Cichorium intybus]